MSRDRSDDDDRSRDRDDGYDDEFDGYDDYDRPRGNPPPNYLTMSILTTLFCCTIFGIVAIVYAAQVNTKWAEGDDRGARAASANAKMWCWLSFGSVIVIMIIAALASLVEGAGR